MFDIYNLIRAILYARDQRVLIIFFQSFDKGKHNEDSGVRFDPVLTLVMALVAPNLALGQSLSHGTHQTVVDGALSLGAWMGGSNAVINNFTVTVDTHLQPARSAVLRLRDRVDDRPLGQSQRGYAGHAVPDRQRPAIAQQFRLFGVSRSTASITCSIRQSK